jgi:hypothetical protein
MFDATVICTGILLRVVGNREIRGESGGEARGVVGLEGGLESETMGLCFLGGRVEVRGPWVLGSSLLPGRVTPVLVRCLSVGFKVTEVGIVDLVLKKVGASTTGGKAALRIKFIQIKAGRETGRLEAALWTDVGVRTQVGTDPRLVTSSFNNIRHHG